MNEIASIKKLDEHVINRIAAGEVIQRPANALKELMENSIDAKATIIQVVVKDGGLKMLQDQFYYLRLNLSKRLIAIVTIVENRNHGNLLLDLKQSGKICPLGSILPPVVEFNCMLIAMVIVVDPSVAMIADNGTGIRYEDFKIVCERFTTSKLEKFEDLSSISTYGFRGEALASISHISHLTIQSRTKQQDCAYKAQYVDSLLKDSPKPCAGNIGTVIVVEDLFYNMNTRRKALKNATEEYRKIADVVGKYAIHNAGIGFSLKRLGENVTIKTPVNSTNIDNIRIIYGNAIAKELINFECQNETLKFTARGYVTNVNYSTKKGIFILFINNRLVESSILKKSIDQIYSVYLPKNSYPFVYMSIEIEAQNVDVNVHPTKHQVNFLHEEHIAEKIATQIEQKILNCKTSRVFYTQAKLPGAQFLKAEKDEDRNKSIRDDKSFVRTNCMDQKLDKYLRSQTEINDGLASNKLLLDTSVVNSNKFEKRETNLTSIRRLRDSIENECHMELREMISEHVFVGSVDINQSLIQHNTKLYLCNNRKLIEELFYQTIIYNFQNFGTISFSKPLPIKQLISIALDLPETKCKLADGCNKMDLTKTAANILMSKSALMDDYFSLKIDSNENLVQIPLLVDDYVPEMAGLPKYLLKLATNVNWKKEQECFATFARVTAKYYARRQELNYIENTNWKWTTENVLYPTLKKYLMPPKSFAKNASILKIADLPDLYKVFERC